VPENINLLETDNSTNNDGQDSDAAENSENNLTASIVNIFTNYTVDVRFTLPIVVFPNYPDFKLDSVVTVAITGRRQKYTFDWNIFYMDP
jgi:hypothetical protein